LDVPGGPGPNHLPALEVLGDERTNVGRDLMFEFDAKERL
jgi:hypothetical protein